MKTFLVLNPRTQKKRKRKKEFVVNPNPTMNLSTFLYAMDTIWVHVHEDMDMDVHSGKMNDDDVVDAGIALKMNDSIHSNYHPMAINGSVVIDVCCTRPVSLAIALVWGHKRRVCLEMMRCDNALHGLSVVAVSDNSSLIIFRIGRGEMENKGVGFSVMVLE